jgi:hypothetical protein
MSYPIHQFIDNNCFSISYYFNEAGYEEKGMLYFDYKYVLHRYPIKCIDVIERMSGELIVQALGRKEIYDYRVHTNTKM